MFFSPAYQKIILLFLLCVTATQVYAQVKPLPNAHAHNDYKHTHPLSDAMACGFTSFEADVFLKHGNLVVAHLSSFLKSKTLEDLYLKPLYDSVVKYRGCAYYKYPQPVILLIDIKTDAALTYAALKPILEKYAPILTHYENGKLDERAITIILSGNKPYEQIKNESVRIAFIDEGLQGIEKNNFDRSFSPLASTKYSNVLSWKGKGKIDAKEEEKLKALISLAHAEGKKVRLWASPENKIVWQQLLNYGVDLINTDDLKGLEEFLLGAGK